MSSGWESYTLAEFGALIEAHGVEVGIYRHQGWWAVRVGLGMHQHPEIGEALRLAVAALEATPLPIAAVPT